MLWHQTDTSDTTTPIIYGVLRYEYTHVRAGKINAAKKNGKY